jgi:outer membrane protein OmpA-like peptidoglycan-associated protein
MAGEAQAAVFPATSDWVVERRWVRRDAPVWPFFWRGALPLWGGLLLLCYALWPFARDEVQASVWHEARAELDASGFAWVRLEVSGQHIRLSGTPPAAGDDDVALELARSATCPTWFGRYTCAVAVSGEFAKPRAAAAPAPAELAPPAAVEPPQAAARACETALAEIVAGSKIEFASGAARLEARSAAVLDALGKATGECPGVIRIEGHTDAMGEPQHNLALSQARAEAVRAALIERGVAASRLRAQGFGADAPLADNRSAEGRAKNRRIEFRVAND